MLFSPDGLDFTSVMEMATFPAGKKKNSVNVPILDDMIVTKSPEIFSAQLKSNQSDVILGISIANISILDNDGKISQHHAPFSKLEYNMIIAHMREILYKTVAHKSSFKPALTNIFPWTDTYIVGFTETMYNVSESDGQVEVCVALNSPEGDIFGGQILVEVFHNSSPERNVTGNHSKASKFSGSIY